MSTQLKDKILLFFFILIPILVWLFIFFCIYKAYIRLTLINMDSKIISETIHLSGDIEPIIIEPTLTSITPAEKIELTTLISKVEKKETMTWDEQAKYIKYLDMEKNADRNITNINGDIIPVLTERAKLRVK